MPPTPDTLRALAATLNWRGYRSAVVYLYGYKTQAQREGHPWGEAMNRLLRDVVRSCERGLGPPIRAQPLPFERLGELPGGRAPWCEGGPTSPRNAVVMGSWWLLREVELSTARAAFVTIERLEQLGRGTATLLLPASKSDPEAFGAARIHRCICSSSPLPRCTLSPTSFFVFVGCF